MLKGEIRCSDKNGRETADTETNDNEVFHNRRQVDV